MKFTRCLEMQERANKRIAGMTHLLSKRPDMFSKGIWPGYFSRAKGSTVWDLDGNVFLDMSISGIGANILGYADDEIDERVVASLRSSVSSSLNCPEEVELAEVLCELHPWADNVRLARTGGEVMAVAVRLARAATGRDVVAFCGYHGWHDWYLAANLAGENALSGHLLPGLSPVGVPKNLAGTAQPFTFNKIEELETIMDRERGNVAAIVMEPIRNDRPVPGFMAALRRLADREGAVLVFDEISAGFRLCTGGAHLDLYDETPDLATFSKALGNGYAISAVIGRHSVMDAANETFISSTNWTERIGPTAGLAVIGKHRRENVADHLMMLGTAVQKGWRKLANKHGLSIEVGGIEPMGHFSMDRPDFNEIKALFIQGMLERSILASNLYYAMHAHTDEDVARYLDAVDEVFGGIAEVLNNRGEVTQHLRGEPSSTGFKRLN